MVNTRVSPLPVRGYSDSPFSRAVVLAVLTEGLIVAVIVVLGLMRPAPVTTGLRQKPLSVHLVTLPRPLPPQMIPKAVPARPKPLLRPIPRPVIHHRPVPLPVPVKRMAPKVVRPVPPRPVLPPPSKAVAAQAVNRYAVEVRSRIEAGLIVPRRIAALGISGRTIVAFKLMPSGRLLWARVARSSGITLIDRASLAAVKSRIYPAFTRMMPDHAVVFRVSVGLNDHRNRF